MSNANEIRARSRRSTVAPRYIQPSRGCKSPSAAPSATSELARAHSRKHSVLESHPDQASSPAFASNEVAKEAFTRSISSSRLTAIRITVNDSQHQLERALNQRKQIHTFDTGTVQGAFRYVRMLSLNPHIFIRTSRQLGLNPAQWICLNIVISDAAEHRQLHYRTGAWVNSPNSHSRVEKMMPEL